MRIKVYNDGLLTFSGDHHDFLEINEDDGDVIDMVAEALLFGSCERSFFSGDWKVVQEDVLKLFTLNRKRTSAVPLTIWDMLAGKKSGLEARGTYLQPDIMIPVYEAERYHRMGMALVVTNGRHITVEVDQ